MIIAHSVSANLLTLPPAGNPSLPYTLQVVKAASGKFHPLHQWFYFDSIESLPDEPLPVEEVAPEVSRGNHTVVWLKVMVWHPWCACWSREKICLRQRKRSGTAATTQEWHLFLRIPPRRAAATTTTSRCLAAPCSAAWRA